MKTPVALAIFLALTAFAASAQQKLYKSVMPDGSVVYSAKPEPNAKRVDTVEPPPPQSGISVVTPQEKVRADQMKRQEATSAKQGNALDDARKQLKQAEAAREAAKESREGERLGTAKGGSRLTDDYFARQKAADAAVESAQKRVQDLERGR